MDEHPAIDRLCQILTSFDNRDIAQQLMIWAGMAINVYPESTGLEPIRDRQVQHLHWDMEIDRVRNRLVHLVEKSDVDEQCIVQGVVGFIESFLEQFASHDEAETKRMSNSSLIDSLQEELKLPVSERRHRGSDAEILDFIPKLETIIAEAEEFRAKHEQVLSEFENERQRLLPAEYWRAFRASRVFKRLEDGEADEFLK